MRVSKETRKLFEDLYKDQVLFGAKYIDARQRPQFNKWLKEKLSGMEVICLGKINTGKELSLLLQVKLLTDNPSLEQIWFNVNDGLSKLK